jgi:hypothetical protein
MQRKNVPLQVRLPADLHAEIKQLTEEEDRPLNRTIIRLLRAGLHSHRLLKKAIEIAEAEQLEKPQ